MLNRPIITYVCSSVPEQIRRECKPKLEKDLGIELIEVNTITEIFPLLSDPLFRTDLISIDFDRIVSGQNETDIFDIIRTLSTLIKCTVHRSGTGKPSRRSTKISLLISEKTDPKLIRQALLIPDVFLGTLMGGSWTYEMVKENVSRNLAGDYTPPKHILDRLKVKKGIIKKDEIVLTPREQQILTLIQERGASNKIIAKILDISESTVKLHIGKILKKYRVKNRTQLAVFSQKTSDPSEVHV